MRTILEKRFRRCIGREKGQTLVLVLCFLALGGLTIANSLNFVTTSINDVKIHQSQMVELYSADAGLQKTIWSLTRDEIEISPGVNVTMDQFLLNTKAVDVNIYNTYESGNRTFKITSTASTGNRSGTTVVSYVKCEISFFYKYDWYEQAAKFELDPGDNFTGNLHLTAGNGVNIGGNMTGSIWADVGNFGFHDGASVTGDIYLKQGNIKISTGAQIFGNICLGKGNITLEDPYTLIEGEIHVWGNVKIQDASGKVIGDIYSTNLIGPGEHDGEWTYTDNTTYECPMLDGFVETYSYEIQ